MHARLAPLACAIVLLPIAGHAGENVALASGASIRANDNRQAAGALENGTLTLELVASQGEWQPEGPRGRRLTVAAFREGNGPLTIPGPLIRVPVGSEIRVAIRNDIFGTTLTVFGLGDRPAAELSAPLTIPAGETRHVRFAARAPGTFHYWATTADRPLTQRRDVDSQLGGAFVIDAPGERLPDAVFVLGLWRKPGTPSPTEKLVEVSTINGRSWPHTEMFDRRVGDVLHWRVVNQSFDHHAMHLHGHHFDVVARGDALQWRTFASAEQPQVVTEHMGPGDTMQMRWTPTRPGNWLFHCHMVVHMTPPPDVAPSHAAHIAEDASAGMAGLVIGIRVSGKAAPPTAASGAPRRFTLKLREEAKRYGDLPGYRVEPEGLEAVRLSDGPVPGPVLALTRGEPVEVSLVNEMSEPTAIHWHGIELESYFDGVPGWGGATGNVTPAITPGQAFVAKFTPPRAGTFIYHTHWHDEAQLRGGVYGALIVLEPGQRFDPATDHVLIVSLDGPSVPGQRPPYVLNGSARSVPAPFPGPLTIPLRAGVANRLRLINITPNNPGLTFLLTDGSRPVSWTPVAKDGSDLPLAQRSAREAKQLVSVGETYDFEIRPAAGERLWLEVRLFNGGWVAQALLNAAPQAP